MEDRTSAFPAGRGFSAALQRQLDKVGLGELSWTVEKGLAAQAFAAKQAQISDSKWVEMARAKSTRFLVVIFHERGLWHEFLSYAGRKTRACLRICLVTWTGSIGVSSSRQTMRRCPFCSAVLDTRHYFLCENGPAYQLELVTLARGKKWPQLLRVSLDIYFRFLFRLRPSVLSEDEAFLTTWDESTETG
jgi:hypothetical protein